MEIKSHKYIIISPVRNEEKNIELTLKSVTAQTVKPQIWIIVDDGSTDNTKNLVNKYVDKYSWIKLIELEDRGYYDLESGGEIKAFYKGFETIKSNDDYDYIAKLDGDISFNEYYYEQLLDHFESNNKLGIASGLCHISVGNKLIPEKTYKKHPRGPARVYRRKCWDEMGGVKDVLTWDAIDVYKARMLGWETLNYKNIIAIHHVKTWEKGGKVHGLKRSGKLQYLMGSHPVFFSIKTAASIIKKPYLIGSFLIAYGYIEAYLKNETIVPEKELLTYIRKEQLKRLLPFLYR